MLKVIGVGDNVVDKYINRGIMYPGGNALNFSVYSQMLEIDSAYLGIFGTDFAGRYVREVISNMGIDVSHCRKIEGENGYACVDIVNGDRKFVDTNHGGVSRLFPLEFIDEDLKYLSHFDLIHSSINSYGFQTFLKSVEGNGAAVSFDFSNRFSDENLMELGQYVNFAICSCGHLSVEETKVLMKKAIAFGYRGVLATRGIEGAYFAEDDHIYFHQSEKQPAKDALGAGDSFCTCFLTNYISSLKRRDLMSYEERSGEIQKALEKATRFATNICMMDGAFDHGTKIQ